MAKYFKRDKYHERAQKEGKQRDNYVCAICGQYDENGQGHHVLQVSQGGPATTQNIMTLCNQCHKDYHHGRLNVDIGLF